MSKIDKRKSSRSTEHKKKISASMKGNDNGLKLKETDIRQEAYQQYCSHLAKGKSKRSFIFDYEGYSVTWETLEKYIKDDTEFDPSQIKVAYAKGFGIWEQLVEDSAKGLNKDANTATLQMAMRNKYGWDKDNAKTKEEDPRLDRLKEIFEEFLK